MDEEFLGLLAHELRSPLSAIVGYHDLMTEGILGDVDPRVTDAVNRMRSAADQLLALVAGMAEAAIRDPDRLFVELSPEDPHAIFDGVLADLAAEAQGRDTHLTVERVPAADTFVTDPDRLRRALLLALHAAIRNAAGTELHVEAFVEEDDFVCTIAGARIDPACDLPPEGPLSAVTTCGLRLGMAEQAISPMGGTLGYEGTGARGRIVLRVPGGLASD